MKTELFTISKIFNESLYRIPDYQRGYSWELQHLKDFWLDLEQLEAGKSHYTGVLTLEPVPDNQLATQNWSDDIWIVKSKRYQPYFVVDGQQRLTTIVILIQSILELKLPTKLNHTLISDIRRKYIFDSKTEQSRSYIFGYIADNPSAEYLKTKIYGEHSNKHSPDEDTIYTKNLRIAKEFFMTRLARMSHAQIEELFTKVTQQLVFNVYEIAKEIDVFVTFETMNNRGKLLSNLELVKNRLIFLAMKMGPDEAAAAKLRENVNEAWKTIYHCLGKNENRPLNDDMFLRTHLHHYYFSELVKYPEEEDERHMAQRGLHIATEQIGRFLLNDLFTQKRLRATKKDAFPPLTPQFVYSYSQNLKQAVNVYYKLSTPSDSTFSAIEKAYLERISRLRGNDPSPFLLSVYTKEKDVKKRARCVELLEHFYFLNVLRAQNGFIRNAPITIDYPRYVSGDLTIDDLIQGLENSITEFSKEVPLTEALSDWVKSGPGYYGWRGIKYFLFEYELSLAEGSKTSRLKIDWDKFCGEDFRTDYDTIEHIYPQKARNVYWTERFGKFTVTQKRLIRNSLGNLLALSRPKNASLSNSAFPDKRGKPDSTIGYNYGGYSENEVSALTDWGPNEVLTRGIKMLSFMEARWHLNLGDDQMKAKALGLEFLFDRSLDNSPRRSD